MAIVENSLEFSKFLTKICRESENQNLSDARSYDELASTERVQLDSTEIRNLLLAPSVRSAVICALLKSMPSIFKPTDSTTRDFIERERVLPYSYAAIGSTQKETPVSGFDNDFNTIELGQGDAVWEAAKDAIRQWKMFPGGWACIWPGNTPIREGEVVAMQAKVMGLWWLNSCRIVYVIDIQDKFGFAYGTLPGHAECGEELFMVEKTPEGTVRYILKAFSRPRVWVARLGYPIARAQQRRFIRDSKASMLKFVSE